MKRALHALLLIFTFLFAQAGVVTHTATHVAADAGGENGLPADTACELCVGYAQIAGGAPLPAPPVLPLGNARYEMASAVAVLPVSFAGFHSHARAPPVVF